MDSTTPRSNREVPRRRGRSETPLCVEAEVTELIPTPYPSALVVNTNPTPELREVRARVNRRRPQRDGASLRSEVDSLTKRLARRENTNAHEINIELLRIGFPARADAPDAELRRIHEYLLGRLSKPSTQWYGSPVRAIVDELRLLPADQLAEVLAHFDRHSAGQSDPS